MMAAEDERNQVERHNRSIFDPDRSVDLEEETAERHRMIAEDMNEETQLNCHEARRNLREKYNESMADIDDDSGDGTIEELVGNLNVADDIVDNIRKPREGAVDAQLLLKCAKVGLEKIQKIEANETDCKIFDPNQFASKLLDYCQSNEYEGKRVMAATGWAHIGRMFGSLLQIAPDVSFMSPCLKPDDPEVRDKKLKNTVNRQQRNAHDQIVLQAQSSSTADNETDSTTTKEVDNVARALSKELKRQGKTEIELFPFVLHPTSFSRSVENMFHLSFLVKDGIVGMKHNEDALPAIYKVSQSEKKQLNVGDQSKAETNQIIMSLNVDLWRNMVHYNQIKEPVIPNL